MLDEATAITTTKAPAAPIPISHNGILGPGGGVVVVDFMVISTVSAKLLLNTTSSNSRGNFVTSIFYGVTARVKVNDVAGIFRVTIGNAIVVYPRIPPETVCALPELGVTVNVAVSV